MSEKLEKKKWKGKIETYQCPKCHFQDRDEVVVRRHMAAKHASKKAAKPAKAVSRMNVAELEAHADSLGIDRSAIEGSGADGAVVKSDLLEAIAAASGNG